MHGLDDGYFDLRGLGSTSAAATLDEVRTGIATLRKGNYNNAAVEELQALLKVSVDGDFGPNTEAAVKAVQVAAGLSPTGVVDTATLMAIEGKPATTSAGRARGFTSAAAKKQAIEAAKAKAAAKASALREAAAAKRASGGSGGGRGAGLMAATGLSTRTLAIAGGSLAALLVVGLVLKRRKSA